MFWPILYSIALVQGAFISFALLVKTTPNRQAARYLALLVGVFTFNVLIALVRDNSNPSQALYATALGINGEFLIAPVVLMFVRAILRPDTKQLPAALLHFLPLGVGLIFWLYIATGQTQGWLGITTQAIGTVVSFFVAIKALFIWAYLIVAYRSLSEGINRYGDFSFDRKRFPMRWLGHWILATGVTASLIYLMYWLEHTGWAIPINSDRFGIIVLTAMIYLVSLMFMLRPWVLAAKPRVVAHTKYDAQIEQLTNQLESEKTFLDPDLSLRQLAESIDMNENALSEVINQGLRCTYYQLMTQYRLAHIDGLLRDPANNGRPILDLAYESGFNSKASFYRLFRETFKMTPKDFLASIHSD